jgi:hypothetical protein
VSVAAELAERVGARETQVKMHQRAVTECAPEDADKLLLSVVGSRIFVSRHKGLKGRNVAGRQAGRWMDRDQLSRTETEPPSD